MNRTGLTLTIERNAVVTFGVLVLGLLGIMSAIDLMTGNGLDRSVGEMAVVAIGAASFHFIAQCLHLLGHALAAWATGYPTSGMLFLYGFAMSQYPADEPLLPDRIHIQRSLGGVLAFALLLGIVVVLWLGTRTSPQWILRALTTCMLINSAVLFVISAIVSDGVLFVVRKAWRRT